MFNLNKEANAGNALAQHELGIRYILGEGVPADTAKGAYWIQKAADQHLPGASYNYGILLNNGWGVAWSPFSAFKYFLDAANDYMPQAEYLIGLEYTDDLLVKRDWGKAYYWIKRASEDGFEPAKKILKDLVSHVDLSNVDTTQNIIQDTSSAVKNNKAKSKNLNTSTLSSSIGLVFIDFNTLKDTSMKITNKMLVEDLLHEGNEKLDSVLNITSKNDTSITLDSSKAKMLIQFADDGSPEALTILGRMYELGIYFPKNLIEASVDYVKASRLDSPRSPYFLWQISRDRNFYIRLKKLVDENDPRAMYIWYGLFTIGFDNQFTDADAIKLLERAANLKYIPAINELGLSYYTGKSVKQNKGKAVQLWQSAKEMGSFESELRLAIIKIYDGKNNSNYSEAVKVIEEAVKRGSILAQATLAYCYQFGLGKTRSLPETVMYYRAAAQRGSRYAYNELKQLYDSVRPSDQVFKIN